MTTPLSPDELAYLKRLLADPEAKVSGALVLRLLRMVETRDEIIRQLTPKNPVT